jgi:DNA-binding NtrC family response regulator
MREIARQVEEAGQTHTGVLVIGEPGTGRGVVARAIHAAGPKPTAEFVPVYCGAMEPSRAESLLFGTPDIATDRPQGAHSHYERIWANGLVHHAIGGTLYLRRVEELPERAQQKLAKLLRDGEAVIGRAATPQRLNLRPIAAVDVDFAEAVRDGHVRSDLYKRLSTVQIVLPPLRERRDDIPALAGYFVSRACEEAGVEPKTVTQPALAVLSAMPWRGNARELDALLRRIVLQISRADIDLDAVLTQIRLDEASCKVPCLEIAGTLREARARFEREYIRAVLAQHRGRIPDAARSLGIQRTNLSRKLRSLKLGKERQSAIQRA